MVRARVDRHGLGILGSMLAISLAGVGVAIPASDAHSDVVRGTDWATMNPSDIDVSSNGRFVVFASRDRFLVPGPDRRGSDIYLADRRNGTLVRVSTNSAGRDANDDCNGAAISGNGRYVGFSCLADNLVPHDTNDEADVFVRDRRSGALTLESRGLDGRAANDRSSMSALSMDGRFIVFTSQASNLVSGDTNGAEDVFRKNLQNEQVVRVSTGRAGRQANDYSARPDVSGDGMTVAYTSAATNLVPGVTDKHVVQAYTTDIQTGRTTLISRRPSGLPAVGGAWDAVISVDGHWAAFTADDPRLGSPSDELSDQVYVRNLRTGVTTRVSSDAAGTPGSLDSAAASFSARGRHVGFVSAASNLVPADTNDHSDVFVKQIRTGHVWRVSTATDGVEAQGGSKGPALSADGSVVAYQSRARNLVSRWQDRDWGAFVRDTDTDRTVLLSRSRPGTQGVDDSEEPAVSADGRYVAFASHSLNFVAGDHNNTVDVFRKDLESGRIVLVSTTSQGELANGVSDRPALSATGQFVAFESRATDLTPGDVNEAVDVFVKDLVTGVVTLVSADRSGLQGDAGSWSPSISADGRAVAFESNSSNLVPGREPSCLWCSTSYVKLLDTDEVLALGDTPADPSSDSHHAAISADGRFVTFTAPIGGVPQVLITDLQTSVTSVVSAKRFGEVGNEESEWASVSGHARFVAFITSATNLPGARLEQPRRVLVKDLRTGSLVAVRGSPYQRVNPELAPVVIASRGHQLSFASPDADLVRKDTNNAVDVFVTRFVVGHRLTISRTLRVSTNRGQQARSGSWAPVLSADGLHVGFTTRAPQLVRSDYNRRYDVFVKNTVTGVVLKASTGWLGDIG